MFCFGQKKEWQMLYELRHYDLISSRARAVLNTRFERHTLPIWKRIGIEAVGFWWVFVGKSPRMTYMLAWESLARREQLWEEFEADTQWQAARAASIAEAGYNPIRTVTSTILRPTPYSFQARQRNQPSRLEGGIFELRSLAFDDGRKLNEVSEWFEQHWQAAMEAHGMFAMGFWTTVIGVAPRLTYMLVFEDLAHRDRAWASFHTDPHFQALQDGLYPNGQPLIVRTDSCLMHGTEFPGWR